MSQNASNNKQDAVFHLPEAVYNIASSINETKVSGKDYNIFLFWQNILQTNDEDQILRSVLLLKQMTNRLYIDIENSRNLGKDTADGYRRALDNFQFFVNPRYLNQQVQDARKSRLTEANLVRFQAMRDFFGPNIPKSSIPNNAMDKCVHEIDEILDDVNENITDLYIAKYLHDELQFLKLCILRFRYLGIFSINEASGRLIANITVNNSRIPNKTAKKIGGVAILAISVVSTYGPLKSGANEIIKDMQTVIEIGSSTVLTYSDPPSHSDGNGGLSDDPHNRDNLNTTRLPGPKNEE